MTALSAVLVGSLGKRRGEQHSGRAVHKPAGLVEHQHRRQRQYAGDPDRSRRWNYAVIELAGVPETTPSSSLRPVLTTPWSRSARSSTARTSTCGGTTAHRFRLHPRLHSTARVSLSALPATRRSAHRPGPMWPNGGSSRQRSALPIETSCMPTRGRSLACRNGHRLVI